MSTLLKDTPRLLVLFCPGNAGTFTFQALYKDGLAVAVSDGAITDNGDETITVSFDANDTDTIGDFSFLVKDVGGNRYMSYGNDVWDAPIGLLKNDGTEALQLLSLSIINGGGDAIYLESTSGTNACVHMASTADGVLIDVDQRGIRIEAPADGISIDAGIGIDISAATGMVLTAAGNALELISTTSGHGLFAEAQSTNGIGINAVGVRNGIAARRSASGLTATTASGFFAGATTGSAVRIKSEDATGILVTGDLCGARFAANSTTDHILYGVVEMSTAFATRLLDLDNSIDTGYSVRATLRLAGAAASGLSSLAGSTRTYSSQDETKTRITATTDLTGQRTAVTRNIT